MTRAVNLLENLKGGAKRERSLTQYSDHGNSASTTGKSKSTLEAGVYKIGMSMSGSAIFSVHEQGMDDLLRFPDERYDTAISEIKKFWESGEKYKTMGVTHTRGICFSGPPGSGKSFLLNLVVESIVEAGDVVFVTRDAYSLGEVLKQFREVEPDRKVAVRLEDFDGMLYAEDSLLNLLDGDSKVDKVLYLATTNYPERLSERIKRPGRFDRLVEIPNPPAAGRLAYLERKLAHVEKADAIAALVEKTDGLSFGALREFIVSVYCLDHGKDETIERLRTHMNLEPRKKNRYSDWGEGKVLAKVEEARTRREKLSRSATLLEEAEKVMGTPSTLATSYLPMQPEAVKLALEKKITSLGFAGILVDSVDVELDGIITVYFSDTKGNELAVAFTYDETEGASATVLDDYGTDDAVFVDLDTLAPPVVQSDFGAYVNMIELSWLNRTTLGTIFAAGEIGGEEPKAARPAIGAMDAFGNLLGVKPESLEVTRHTIRSGGKIVEASYKTVIRGGKKARLPIVRKKKVGKLTTGARMALSRRRATGEGKTRARSLKLEAKTNEATHQNSKDLDAEMRKSFTVVADTAEPNLVSFLVDLKGKTDNEARPMLRTMGQKHGMPFTRIVKNNQPHFGGKSFNPGKGQDLYVVQFQWHQS